MEEQIEKVRNIGWIIREGKTMVRMEWAVGHLWGREVVCKKNVLRKMNYWSAQMTVFFGV